MSGRLLVEAGTRGLFLFGPLFDRLFLFGTVGVALGLGALASVSPNMFVAVVLVDIWLFASPHIIATYTRIGFDRAHVKKHWFLIFCLPPIVLVLVTMVSLAYELGGLFTLYFVTQTYHVTRQSFGISRAYRRLDSRAIRHDWLSEVLIYLFPIWGLLHRCATAPDVFYGFPIHLPGVPAALSDATGIVAVITCSVWAYQQVQLAIAGRLNTGHCLFVASHLFVIGIAYLWVTDITSGWLVVNIWHNLQYLMFVWVKNVQREEQLLSNVDMPLPPAQRLLRQRSPWKGMAKYSILCLVLGAMMYEGLNLAGQQLIWLGLPTVLILHFTVNFHHYLVDGVIWKRQESVVLRGA